MPQPTQNLDALSRELDWLCATIQHAVASYLQPDGHEAPSEGIPPPELDTDSRYGQQVWEWQLDRHERLAIALLLAPHLRPEALDVFLVVNSATGRRFTEFGGRTDRAFSGFLPTGQTLVFLLSARCPARRFDAMRILAPQHRFASEQVIALEHLDDTLPAMAGVLTLSERWLHYLLTGERLRPEPSAAFPARAITTALQWSDLVLDDSVRGQVQEIRTWLDHGNTLMHDWGLADRVKPGFRTVFCGPPGSGKTLAAALLGQSTGREVYRVDLSMAVSGYIGETEKNLGKLFDMASRNQWVLFFDEADALFGNHAAASTAGDRYTTPQIGYLRQRIKNFPGLIILATGHEANGDEAFTRCFQSMIHFAKPPIAQRLQLWKNAFDGVCELGPDVDLAQLAQDYELAGGAIANVLRHCALTAISRNSRTVERGDLIEGIKRELHKDNRTL